MTDMLFRPVRFIKASLPPIVTFPPIDVNPSSPVRLGISSNTVLTSLTGLYNLNSINGNLSVHDNPTLISLTGLENIVADSIENLKVYNNASLSTCHVQSICDYLLIPNSSATIYDNAPGCSSQEEVEEACLNTMVEELNATENYSIYPNPVTDIASFSSEEITTFELYDLMGKLIIKRNTNTVDMSNLNPGIYFVIGFDKNKHALYKGKIIKN